MKLKSLSAGVATAALCVGMASAAHAEMVKPGFYVSGGAGINWLDDHENGGQTVEFDNGYAIQSAVGYDFGDRSDMGKFRLEAELSYSENDVDSLSAGGVTASIGGEVEQVGYMVNAYWDFIPGGTLRPYVGIGLGAMDTDVTVSAGGFTGSGSDTEFAYRGMLGLSYHMNQNWALDIGFRHTRVDYDETLENNTLLTNLRYKF